MTLKEDTVKRIFIIEEGELEPGQKVTIQLSEKLDRMKETKAASKMVIYLVAVIFVLNSTISVAPLLDIPPKTCTLAGCLNSTIFTVAFTTSCFFLIRTVDRYFLLGS